MISLRFTEDLELAFDRFVELLETTFSKFEVLSFKASSSIISMEEFKTGGGIEWNLSSFGRSCDDFRLPRIDFGFLVSKRAFEFLGVRPKDFSSLTKILTP